MTVYVQGESWNHLVASQLGRWYYDEDIAMIVEKQAKFMFRYTALYCSVLYL